MARRLRDHAFSDERHFWHTYLGFNYRMTTLQAAALLRPSVSPSWLTDAAPMRAATRSSYTTCRGSVCRRRRRGRRTSSGCTAWWSSPSSAARGTSCVSASPGRESRRGHFSYRSICNRSISRRSRGSVSRSPNRLASGACICRRGHASLRPRSSTSRTPSSELRKATGRVEPPVGARYDARRAEANRPPPMGVAGVPLLGGSRGPCVIRWRVPCGETK